MRLFMGMVDERRQHGAGRCKVHCLAMNEGVTVNEGVAFTSAYPQPTLIAGSLHPSASLYRSGDTPSL